MEDSERAAPPSAPFKQVTSLTFGDKAKVVREGACVNRIKQLIDGDGMRPLVTFNGGASFEETKNQNEGKGHARRGALCCWCHLKVPYYCKFLLTGVFLTGVNVAEVKLIVYFVCFLRFVDSST